MAHSLGFQVIAEGVDSEEQKAILTEWGCDAIQGFLISAARKPDDFLAFVLDWKGDREKSNPDRA
jgi:EAL domain-containing protein (putative c-di-GMP-specific phosphodiesterase class I)